MFLGGIMKFVHCAVALAASVVSLPVGGALAAPKCNIVGTWTDTLGTTVVFKSEKKGTLNNVSLCPKSYAVKVTKLTELVLDVTGSTKDKVCPTPFSVGGEFQNGGCTTVSGSITITGIGTLSDTFTKQSSPAVRTAPADTSKLVAGLK
jgi:hypothetical protein